MCFICIFGWLLRSNEASLTKSLLQCKSSNEFAAKYEFLLSNDQPI